MYIYIFIIVPRTHHIPCDYYCFGQLPSFKMYPGWNYPRLTTVQYFYCKVGVTVLGGCCPTGWLSWGLIVWLLFRETLSFYHLSGVSWPFKQNSFLQSHITFKRICIFVHFHFFHFNQCKDAYWCHIVLPSIQGYTYKGTLHLPDHCICH